MTEKKEKKKFRNPYIEQRKQNLQVLKEIIRDETPIKHRKAVALMGMYGVRKKTAVSYLETLQDAGFIKYDSEAAEWSIIEEVPKEG